MTLTRFQKEECVPLRANTSQRTEQANVRRSEGTTSIEAIATNLRSSNMESSGYTATKVTKMFENGARLKEQKTTDEMMAEWKNQNRTLKTIESGGFIRTSVRSKRTAARLRELEAREELALLELQRAEAAANLARIRFEKQRIEDKVSFRRRSG
ncbi:uncharacterized protein LOC123870197 [Maniola jurtina]|uniref:uncharacterized protein LOC123870197 n=1 Tax=Maniola jurtina TaxID=191418 RepID=UPI001E68D155|nr:uncharacterized protein LOC123870197 [Maniola jurtina]